MAKKSCMQKTNFPLSTLGSRIFCLQSLCFFALLGSQNAMGAFSHYKSTLIGDRAAGMGGAFTALTDDPSSVAYYNPASVARMKGSSLSASASVYHKYDTNFGQDVDILDASQRVNRGSFRTIASSGGSLVSYGNFAYGLSVIVPDYEYFAGEISSSKSSTEQTTTYLQYQDESLWVGPTIGLNISDTSSVGMTVYYTSRNFLRSTIDQKIVDGSPKQIISYNEENTSTNNSVVFIFGYYKKWDNYSFGVSLQMPSIEINGNAYILKTNLDTNDTDSFDLTSENSVKNDMPIASKLSFGFAYEEPKNKTISFDINIHGPNEHYDYGDESYSTKIDALQTINFALGFEYYIKSFLSWRAGLYSNFTPRPEVNNANPVKHSEHVDMWGFSSNFAFWNSDKISFTFGGYYSGGKGESAQYINGQIRKVEKNEQIFSMLLASTYYF